LPERYVGRTLGRFRIEALVGSGGFAWVYRGYDPELDIPVAVKVLKPQFAGDDTFESRFRREASIAAKLRHPNIVRILAVGRELDAVYFVMDYLPNSLVERMRVLGPMPEAFTVRMGVEVALALGFAHREGVVHRDIKADNILFDPHGNAVVADFGIARAASSYVQETGTNMVVGTPQYFSPEQARGLQLDGRADIYSLGVTLYRAATGKLPFDGQDWYEIARLHVEEKPPKPRSINPSISADLERIILRCLAKDREERFETGEELSEALAVLAPHTTDPSIARTLQVARITPRQQSAWARIGSSRWVRRGVVALGSGAVILALAFAMSGKLTEPPQNAVADTVGLAADTVPDPSLAPVTAAIPNGEPEREPQSAPTLATLRITAPDSARITVDGEVRGRGTLRLTNVAPGAHEITAALPGADGCASAAVSRRVTLAAGRTEAVSLQPRRCGALVLRITPPSASFELRSGDGPTRSGIVMQEPILLLAPGVYQLRLRAEGCEDYEAALTVVEGQREPHFATLLDCPAPPAKSR
jgi:serine/threonine-protein kinase